MSLKVIKVIRLNDVISLIDGDTISAIGGGAAITGDHGNLSGLSDDDHLQYLNLNGRSGSQAQFIIGNVSLTSGMLGINLSGSAEALLDTKYAYAAITQSLFCGTGLDDLTVSAANYFGPTQRFRVRLDNEAANPDQFSVRVNNGAGEIINSTVSITGGDISLKNGIVINFSSTNGHQLGDVWEFTLSARENFIARDCDGSATQWMSARNHRVANMVIGEPTWNASQDEFFIAHESFFSQGLVPTRYAMKHNSDGVTTINCYSTRGIMLAEDNAPRVYLKRARFGIAVNIPLHYLDIFCPASSTGNALFRMNHGQISQAWIKFQSTGTAVAGVSQHLTTWTTGNNIEGFFKIDVQGVDKWVPYYGAPTS